MALLLVLLLLAAIAVGVGFVVKWLFIVAAVLAVLAIISYFAGASRGRGGVTT